MNELKKSPRVHDFKTAAPSSPSSFEVNCWTSSMCDLNYMRVCVVSCVRVHTCIDTRTTHAYLTLATTLTQFARRKLC